MWCLVLTSPCCCGPCETRITTGAKVVFKFLSELLFLVLSRCMHMIPLRCIVADCLYLQHCVVELPSCLLHTATHVGKNRFWGRKKRFLKWKKTRCMWPFSAGSWPAQISADWLASGNNRISCQVTCWCFTYMFLIGSEMYVAPMTFWLFADFANFADFADFPNYANYADFAADFLTFSQQYHIWYPQSACFWKI